MGYTKIKKRKALFNFAVTTFGIIALLISAVFVPQQSARAADITGWKKIVTSGSYFTCGIDLTDTVYCWGDDYYDTLGNGDEAGSSLYPYPIDVSGVLAGKTITDIDVWGTIGCVIADGGVYCWGGGADSMYGPLGNGTNIGSSVPVAVDMSGALAGKTIEKLVVGGATNCVIADGGAYCWGMNYFGALGIGSTTDSWVPVAVDMSGVLAGKTITDLETNGVVTCAVADGAAYCWGNNQRGFLGDGGEISLHRTVSTPAPVYADGVLSGKTVTDISIGSTSVCVIASGEVFCWAGDTEGHGSLGSGEYSTSYSNVPVAVDMTGVLSGKTITNVYTGYNTGCVADSTFQLYCWGSNGYGLFADEKTIVKSAVPVVIDTTGVLSGKVITDFSMRSYSSCAIADTQAYCWGDNYGGHLGSGDNVNKYVPTLVLAEPPPLPPVAKITGISFAERDGKKYLEINGESFLSDDDFLFQALENQLLFLNGRPIPLCSFPALTEQLVMMGVDENLYSEEPICMMLVTSDMEIAISDTLIPIWIPDDFNTTEPVSIELTTAVLGTLSYSTTTDSSGDGISEGGVLAPTGMSAILPLITGLFTITLSGAAILRRTLSRRA